MPFPKLDVVVVECSSWVILLRAYLLEDILLVQEWGEMKTAK
jgi:hypothetical protein